MVRRSLVLGALLCGSSLSATAFAQAITDAVPPERQNLDGNYVDRATGGVYYPHPVLQIGPEGRGGLTLRGTAGYAINRSDDGGSGYSVGTNWGLIIGCGDATCYVYLGPTSDTFTLSGGVYTSTSGSGATLTKSGTAYTYTAADGTVILYDNTLVSYDESSGGGTTVRASKITYPTGEVNTLTWARAKFCTNENDGCSGGSYHYHVRLQSVSSSLGYMLHFNYQGEADGTESDFAIPWNTVSSIVGINTSLDYCAPAATSCTISNQTAPKLTFASVWSGSTYTLTITDPLSRVYKYVATTTGLTVQTPSNSSANITYTLSSGLVTQVVRNGSTYTYADSTSGTVRTVTMTDPLGLSSTTTADTSLDALLSSTDPLGHTTSYTYDSNGYLASITYPEGNQVTYTNDSRGNATTTTQVAKSGSGLSNIVTTAVYPTTCTYKLTCNQPTSVTDANGNTTTYTYDTTHGGVLTVTSPAVNGIAPQTRYTYTALSPYVKNSSGSIVASTSAYRLTSTSMCRTTASCTGGSDETKVTTTYGSTGVANNLLPTAVTMAAGDGSLSAAIAMTNDAVGNVVSRTDPLGNVTSYTYDADRELLSTVGPDPDGSGSLSRRASVNHYTSEGLIDTVSVGTTTSDGATFTALQVKATAYDSSNRKISDTLWDGTQSTRYAVVQYSYDADSRLQCTAQRMNTAVFASLPTSACTLGTTGSYGADRIFYNTYDNAGHLLKLTRAYGVSGSQRDDAIYTYSNNGKILSLADAKSNLTTYSYDGVDRLLKTQFPSSTTAGTSSTTDYEQLGYDANGNVTSKRLRDGTSTSYAYDALNRLSSKTPPSGELAVTYTYDNLGHPKQISRASDSANLVYVFDALGRMTSETQAFGSVAYQYDLGGRRTRLTWQDGTYLTYGYDNAGEMTSIAENGSTTLASFIYDNLGERTARTLANGTSTAYGYDAVSRLTSLTLSGGTNTDTVTLGSYNPAGDIGSRAESNTAFSWTGGVNVNRAYTVSGLNQYATVAGASQAYDARGNLTSSGGTTYAYTSENLLKTVSGGVSLYYDPIGRLHEYDTTATTRFVYDGDNMSEELNSSGTVLRRYVFGPASDEAIVWYEGSGTGTKRYMDQDERGSVTRITNADGTTYTVNSYDEYGIPGTANLGRFGYTGQAWLSEAGLAYYKARMYSASLGRFMQTDPIGYADGPNWYNYVGSNPINRIDPYGLLDTCAYTNGSHYGSGGQIVVNANVSTCHYVQESDPSSGSSEKNDGTSSTKNEIVVTARRNSQKVFAQILQWWSANKGCLEAVGKGGLDAAIDPVSLLATGTTGLITSAGTIARASYQLSRAVTLARAAIPGFLVGEGVVAVYGGIKTYMTDTSCR